ncbi:MAG: hypothetical protein WCD20_03215 [Rhodomicrobium sp.]
MALDLLQLAPIYHGRDPILAEVQKHTAVIGQVSPVGGADV